MNDKTNWIRWGAGLLWLAGLWLLLAQPTPPALPKRTDKERLIQTTNYLFDSQTGPTLVLRVGEKLTRIMATDSALLLNKEPLRFRSDSVPGRVVKTPVNLPVWRQYFALLLGNVPSSNAEQWNIARQKIATFCAKDGGPKTALSPANDQSDKALLERFILFVTARQKASETTFILYNNLTLDRLTAQTLASWQTIQLEKPALNNSPASTSGNQPWGIGLLALGGLLWGILAFIGPKKTDSHETPVVKTPTAQPPVVAEKPATQPVEAIKPELEQPDNQELITEKAALTLYLTSFYQRYGDFYDRLQTLPNDLSEQEQQRIRRELVEMALHAHAFVEGSQHLPLTRLTEIPNVQLLVQPTNRQPAPDLTTDPYKTPKRYRVLLSILQEMKLGELENVLLQDLHIPKDLL